MNATDKTKLKAHLTELRSRLDQLKTTQPADAVPAAGATLDPLTVLLEDLFDFLLELLDAII